MKRFLKITSYGVFNTDFIDRDDLARVKNKDYDYLIDTQEGKYFDAENNSWKDIEVQ